MGGPHKKADELPGLARRLREMREALGYSQGDFAARLGLSLSTYNAAECGANSRACLLARIATKTPYSLDWLLTGAGPKFREPVVHWQNACCMRELLRLVRNSTDPERVDRILGRVEVAIDGLIGDPGVADVSIQISQGAYWPDGTGGIIIMDKDTGEIIGTSTGTSILPGDIPEMPEISDPDDSHDSS